MTGPRHDEASGPDAARRTRDVGRREAAAARRAADVGRRADDAGRRGGEAGASVAVVGGGVAGLSLARALAVRGVRATLLEAAGALGGPERPAGAGASSLPVALLNPWRGRKGAAHPDDLLGLATTWRLAGALGAEGLAPGAERVGVLRLPTSARQARAWRRRAEDAEDPAAAALAWLPPERVPPPYDAPFGAVLVRDGGRIEPRRWLAALAASASARGAELRTGVRVEALRRRGGGGWSLHDTAGAELLAADSVVLAVGADAAPRIEGAGTAQPPDLRRARGEVATLRSPTTLPHAVAGGVYGASAPGGPTWVGGGHRDPEEEDPAAAAKLRAAFARAVPALADAPVAGVWSGVRAARPHDPRPYVAPIGPDLWWFGAFSGRGFLCAASEAERLARALEGGRAPRTDADPSRP